MTILTKRIVRFLVALLAVFASGAGGVAFASHQFSDVGNVGFHDQIGAIVDAGCATGFNDGTFRPQSGTTRGQFAFWMNNCGGRAAFDQDDVVLPDLDAPQVVAATSMEAGAAGNGGGFAVVMVDVQGLGTCTTGCQVRVDLSFKDASDPNFSLQDSVTLDLFAPAASPAGNSQANGSLLRIRTMEAGDTLQVRATATKVFGDGSPSVDAELVIMSFPFDGQGNGAGSI